MPSKSSSATRKPKPESTPESENDKLVKELRSRAELTELRARDIEAQARLFEGHTRLIKARSELAQLQKSSGSAATPAT